MKVNVSLSIAAVLIFSSSMQKAHAEPNEDILRMKKCNPKECRAKVLAKVIPPNLKLAVQESINQTTVPILVPIINPKLTGESGYLSKYIYGFDFNKVKVCRNIARYCIYGYIQGELVRKGSLSIAQVHKSRRCYMVSGRFGIAKTILLSKNLTGFYLPPCCNAYCGEAYIVWRQNGHQYKVGIYEPKNIEELIEFAKSAIDNQP